MYYLKSISVVCLALLILNITNAEETKKKTKREYFTSRARHPTSTEYNPYNDDQYYGYNSESRSAKTKEGASVILKQADQRQEDGSYSFEFETQNGIKRQESSVQNGDERVVRGSYAYIGPDGVTYTVNYIADRNGYRAYGAHLPTQPEAVANIYTPVGAISSTPPSVIPIYNRPSNGFQQQYPSSTPSPFLSTISPTTPVNGFQQIFPSSSQNPFFGGASPTPSPPGFSVVSSPSPFFSSTTPPPPFGFGFSSTAAPPQFASSTPFPISRPTLTHYPTSTPSPFSSVTPQSNYNGGQQETVYITPSPKTYVNGLSLNQQNFLHRDLVPPQIGAFQSQFDFSQVPNNEQHIFQQNGPTFQQNLPNVQPLHSRFGPTSYSSIPPSSFDRVLPSRFK